MVGVLVRNGERRVLVVEDEALIASLIEATLGDAGFSVVGPIATIASALATIERERVDLAVLDIRINGSHAYAIADELAARGIPFVFVSGFARKDMPPSYRHCAHIAKPFEPEAIVVALERALPPR